MKKIIVTGGSGFIGSNLVNYLIKKKYFVVNIDKLTYSSNKYNNKNITKNIQSRVYLNGRKNLIKRCLNNLIENSIKYANKLNEKYKIDLKRKFQL